MTQPAVQSQCHFQECEAREWTRAETQNQSASSQASTQSTIRFKFSNIPISNMG